MVLVIGDMASWHSGADPPLAMAIASTIAATLPSAHVTVLDDPNPPGGLRDAISTAAARAATSGQLEVLLLSHDVSWTEVLAEGLAPIPGGALWVQGQGGAGVAGCLRHQNGGRCEGDACRGKGVRGAL